MTIQELCDQITDYAKENDFIMEIVDEEDLDKEIQLISIDLLKKTIIFS